MVPHVNWIDKNLDKILPYQNGVKNKEMWEIKYLSSIQETLYKSPKQVSYSGGGSGYWPGQYVPQLLSSAFDAVVA